MKAPVMQQWESEEICLGLLLKILASDISASVILILHTYAMNFMCGFVSLSLYSFYGNKRR